jgi:pyridoxamine 5'-phosphate oxidase
MDDWPALFDAFDPGADHRLPEPLPPDPFPLLIAWFDRAVKGRIQPNPNAMTLATVDPDGLPSSRIVLCRGIDPAAGTLTFFTNYRGRKGRALAAHPHASLHFHWDPFDAQARIEGPVERTSDAESDAYFAARAWQSRLSAWTSDQSEPIESRAELLNKLRSTVERLGLRPRDLLERGNAAAIPRPPHWGGFRVTAHRVELWLGGVGRLHERAEWTRSLGRDTSAGSASGGPRPSWHATRLQP